MHTDFASKTFCLIVKRLDSIFERYLARISQQLANNPLAGKPLKFSFFREKRFREKRTYYLVYEDFLIVLFVAVSDKKNQQQTINYVVGRLDDFRSEAEMLFRRGV